MNSSNKKCGCHIPAKEENIKQNYPNQKTLKIKWQRLITEGETCPRCGSTEQELEKATDKLKQALIPLGIKVFLEKEEMNISEFKSDPLQSNRIWINGQPIEGLIKGAVGQSPCCDVCGPSDCRTIELNGEKHETIPADLIIQASLIVVNDILNSNNNNSCCNNY